MLFLYAALFVILITGLLCNIFLSVKAHITANQSDIWLNLRFFYRLIKMSVHIRLYSKRGEELRLVRIYNNGKEKLIFPKEGRESAFFSALKRQIKHKGFACFIGLKKAQVYSRIGTGAPDVTVYACSALKIAAEIFFLYLFPDKSDNISVSALPDFDRKAFILNLECIFSACTVKIILIIINAIFTMKPKGE